MRVVPTRWHGRATFVVTTSGTSIAGSHPLVVTTNGTACHACGAHRMARACHIRALPSQVPLPSLAAVDVAETRIPGVKVLFPRKLGDPRGFLSETYRSKDLAEAGIDADFVQENDSFSARAGTVRGLHFQVPPAVQAKLVRVVSGAILDVAVDLRRGSPTFGKHVAVEISREKWNQVFVPAGFAHGFCTLAPDTHVLYKVTAYYSPQHERGLLWNDPALGIAWLIPPGGPVLSERDKSLPKLADLPAYF